MVLSGVKLKFVIYFVGLHRKRNIDLVIWAKKILPPKTSEEGSDIGIQFFQVAELSCLTVIRV